MNESLRPLLCRSIVAAFLVLASGVRAESASSAPPPATTAAVPLEDVSPLLASTKTRVEALLARNDLAAYRGWLRFLRYEAETAISRSGSTSEAAGVKVHRLREWAERIAADPKTLENLRGVQEWAYESPADDSGQPFRIAIPSDYDPKRPAALSVYMHGYSGNHLEHSVGMTSRLGTFDIAVLGRGRGGGYRALSEADVLQAIDYVQAHWAIDPDRIRLNGGSMGGGATFRLGSRYPHRWASGRPTCGFGSFIPFGNLLTFPIYATHSADDWTVSVLFSRGPLARLREMGGVAILDETTGYGHAVWNYKEGNARGSVWEDKQVRPASREVRRIDYTALDGAAVRSWWAEVAEWGPAAKPARFILTAAPDNLLLAELTNLSALRLRLSESPFDVRQPLSVSVGGAVPLVLPAPLPESVILRRSETGWSFETKTEALPMRLHTPGGAALLYAGEPLLIVYGTGGSDAERAAMCAAAEAASKSPNPRWMPDGGDLGPDGVPHSQNLYGQLNRKADVDVTDADIARCHLVLIGTAAQNRVVARMAARLPVSFADGAITCSDGVRFASAHRISGLVHFNPLAPDRLVFWVASDDASAYRADAFPTLITSGVSMSGSPCSGDLIVGETATPTLVATRAFDSRWNWSGRHDASPLLPPSLATQGALTEALAKAVRRVCAADFGFFERSADATTPAVVAGETRLEDVRSLYYFTPIGELELSGAELKSLMAAMAADPLLAVSPAYVAETVNPDRTYRVAMPVDTIGSLARVGHQAPARHRLLDADVGEAVERFLLENE
ncbi:hypothetical protein DB347_02850 [Opitutaceae bacterium EW11]|nr:hypothetical protein DB347_02850 [Opitutaceae bacterium EW11]